MIKIALFCDPPVYGGGGGVYKYCVSLKELLESSKKYQVSLFSDFDYKSISQLRIFDEKQLCECLTKEKFDYIHINGFMTFLPFQLFRCIKKLKLDVPVIYTPHAHPFYTLNHPFRNRVFFNIFVAPCMKKADKIVAINNEDYAFFNKFNKNCARIPHWITDTKKTAPAKKPATSQKKTTKKSNSKKKILFVGRNDDNKNLKQLYVLPENKYEVICVTNTVPDRKDFIFKTNVSDKELSSLYKKSDLLVVPSRYEAFSLVTVECLNYGTPVLLSDRVRIADWLEGCSGVTVYDFNDSEDFTVKFEEALKSKVNTRFVNNMFSAKKAYKSYSEIFK